MSKYLQAFKKWNKADPAWCKIDCFMVPFDLFLAAIWLATDNVVPALFLIAAAMLSASAVVRKFSRYL